MVWLPPEPGSRWRRMLEPTPHFRVDRKRSRAKRPITFLTAPAGLRRLQMLVAGGLGDAVVAQVGINVYRGQWRQLTIGQGAYPPVFDERGVNVNTVTPPGRRQVTLGLVAFFVPVLLALLVTLAIFGSLALLYLRDRL